MADARKALKPIAELANTLSGLGTRLQALDEAGKCDGTWASTIGCRTEQLSSRGLALKGRLPTPTVGPLTLELPRW